MHFLNACILKTDEKNALRFKNADFKNQMSDAIVHFWWKTFWKIPGQFFYQDRIFQDFLITGQENSGTEFSWSHGNSWREN